MTSARAELPAAFAARMEAWRQRTESALERCLPPETAVLHGRLTEAMRYSLLAGGKRLRPVLAYATADALLNGRGAAYEAEPAPAALDNFAVALEMIHTYSLVHDDLPCMDNDDLRRGRPTSHKAFGEGVAVLAGDALLNRAFELLFDVAESEGARGVRAGRRVAALAGRDGMIGGQMIDIDHGTGARVLDEPGLVQLQAMKTGALLSCPLSGTALLFGAAPELVDQMARFGALLGRAFQIQDDLLDVTANPEALGKTVGKDARDGKVTFVTLLGETGARQRLAAVTDELAAHGDVLDAGGVSTAFLRALIDYLNRRTQ